MRRLRLMLDVRSALARLARAAAFRAPSFLAIGWLASAGGCCIWRTHNPISDKLVLSRQFAQQGVNALARRNLGEAERLCCEAVRAAPDDAAARMHYADVLWAQKRYRDALAQIEAASEKNPNDAAITLRAAEMHLEIGRTDEALREAQHAVDLNPRLPHAWLVRGRVHRQAGRPREALADWQRALSYDPRNREALRLAAELYRESGDAHRALMNLQALADTYPPGEEPQSLYVDQGLTYAEMGRHADAADALATACRRGPTGADLLMLLAEAQSASGASAAAYEAAQQAVYLAPDDPRCRDLLQRTAAAVPVGGTVRR